MSLNNSVALFKTCNQLCTLFVGAEKSHVEKSRNVSNQYMAINFLISGMLKRQTKSFKFLR